MSPLLAVAMATALFFALAIFGIGALTYLTRTEPVSAPGVSLAAGIVAMAAGVIVFALTLWPTVRAARPALTRAWTTALATPLVHLVVLWIAVFLSVPGFIRGRGFFLATTVVDGFVRGGFSGLLLLAALLAASGGILARWSGSKRPRWSWERRDDDEE